MPFGPVSEIGVDMSTQLLFVPSHAIQTKYHGVLFRSRIEARWAVFYDALGIEWEYEKEGYQLPGNLGAYLPDFWIPSLSCWIEIKGANPSKAERDKCEALATITNHVVYLFYGKIPYPSPESSESSEWIGPNGAWDCGYYWCQCQDCGKFGIEFNGRADRLPCKETFQTWEERTDKKIFLYEEGKCTRYGFNGDKGYNSSSEDLLRAYGAASLARF